MRKCSNCKNRAFRGLYGMPDYCLDYAMTHNEEEEINVANDCTLYERGTPSCLEQDEGCPSSTNRDYGPGNPWDAPGMSIRDFI